MLLISGSNSRIRLHTTASTDVSRHSLLSAVQFKWTQYQQKLNQRFLTFSVPIPIQLIHKTLYHLNHMSIKDSYTCPVINMFKINNCSIISYCFVISSGKSFSDNKLIDYKCFDKLPHITKPSLHPSAFFQHTYGVHAFTVKNPWSKTIVTSVKSLLQQLPTQFRTTHRQHFVNT